MTTAFTFTPATREQAKARLALAGPPGSGKTMTALILATTMADRVALIDTERGSASKYAAGKSGAGFAFDTLQLTKYDPRDLVGALAAAGDAGYGAVVVDSLSHFWMGSGGMLELVDAIGKRAGAGGGFGGWKEARPFERAMIDALLAYPGHVIVTMRTKTEWLIDDSSGRKKITKVGTKAEQREGIEYEFDLVGDLDQENTLVVSKSRCPELAGQVINRPGTDMATVLMEWLNDGAEVPDVAELVDEAVANNLTFQEARALHAKAERYRLVGAAILHPTTGQQTTLGELIIERGQALRNAGAKAPTPRPTLVPEPGTQQTPPHVVAAALADVPPESLTPAGRDYLHEAHAAPDAATVRQIWQDAKSEGARQGYLDQIVEVGKEKAAARQRPVEAAGGIAPDADGEHAAAVAELRAFAATAGLPDVDTDAYSALGVPLADASAEAIRSLLNQLRGTAA